MRRRCWCWRFRFIVTVKTEVALDRLGGWRGAVLAAVLLIALAGGVERRVSAGIPPGRGEVSGGRAVAADFAWLAAHGAWERRDPLAVTAAVRRAVAWDPDRREFWINGARMIAYDLPAWRIAEAGGREAVPNGVAQRWRDDGAVQALAHLEAALVRHPEAYDFAIEQGNIELWARGNLAGAAEAFGRAAAMPGAPGYARRLEVGLLRRLEELRRGR